ncbi:MAG TPA: AsmA-like C-terminal region-containing protein, partial [Aggregatilineaceae bacterium]|nr:AsmA-like C-terminal region-containing protein [Aggregatilineaceae bacterium]
AVEHVTWGPDPVLDAQALVQFDAGPTVTVAAAWQPGVLDVQRLQIKDAISDATLAVQSKDRLVHARFSGALFEHTFDAMLNLPHEHVGHVAGDLRLTLDLESRGRTTAEGSLQAKALDLSDLLHQPLKLDRLDVTADGTVLRIKEAVLNWAQQVATIKGEVKRGERKPIVTAELDSPGIVIDALLTAGKGTVKQRPPDSAHKPPGAHSEQKPARAQGAPIFPNLWPLPITGQFKVQAGFIEYQDRRVEAVSTILILAERQIQFDLQDAQLCGIAFPLQLEIEPRQVTASVHIDARQQELEHTLQCLSHRHVLITGDFDAGADLKTQGGLDELLKNLQGTVRFEARNGRVIKFALLGSVLATKDVSALFKHGGPQLTTDGFGYLKLSANGHFQGGRFFVEEATFDGGTFGLAATGWVSLLDGNTQLAVLVAPFGIIDRLVRAIPIVGYVFGSTLTSLPVGVSGDIRHPRVVPRDPLAVSAELGGILTRIFKMPPKQRAPSSSLQEPKASLREQ